MERIGELTAATSKGTVGRLLSLVERRPPGQVLDAPAGQGATSRLLHEAGFDVTALEMVAENFAAREVRVVPADMNVPLPFPDEAFDYVVSVDGIEHLENTFACVREFGRVLRPGGELFLSTPNVSAFRSRARFLLTGFHNKWKKPLTEETPDPLHHLNLVTFPEIRYALHRSGFVLCEITTNRVKLAAWPYVLLYPFAALATALAFAKEKDPRQRELNREIYRQSLSFPVAMGETLIVSARKRGS